MKTFGGEGGGAAFEALTTSRMARFNVETPDMPGVKYYSYGAEFTAGWSSPFRIPWGIVYEQEGPNDGLVSVESAKWGSYKGTLHGVNHLDLIGWVDRVKYALAEWTGKKTGYKPISFYLAVMEMLAEE
ncbi:alpha/beta-hydrolase, partial [Atractiella rhizophila]